jgi:ABC-type nitrate/sulfonate/bicarbonate transport system substrate-binding protein
MVVSEDFAEREPETVRAFVSAALKSFEYVLDNPEEAGRIVESIYPTIPAPITVAALGELEAIATDKGAVDRIGTIEPDKVVSTVAWAEEAFGVSVDPETIYTTEFLD